MKKIIWLICMILVLSSCIKNKQEDNIEVENSKNIETKVTIEDESRDLREKHVWRNSVTEREDISYNKLNIIKFNEWSLSFNYPRNWKTKSEIKDINWENIKIITINSDNFRIWKSLESWERETNLKIELFISDNEKILNIPYWMFFWEEKSIIVIDEYWNKSFIKIYIYYLSDNPLTDDTIWIKEYREEIKKINDNYEIIIDNMLNSIKKKFVYDVKDIKDYYSNIQKWDLEEAYNIKYEPNISLEEFKKQYEFDWWVKITEDRFKNIWENRYSFIVDIFYEKTWLVERYNTSMEIIELDKLKTLYVKKIETEITDKVEFWWIKAYVEWDKWEKNLYLEKKWKKEVLKSLKVFFDENKKFNYPEWEYSFLSYLQKIYWLKFIDNGNILVFEESWWEFHWFSFYNVKNWKLLELWDLLNYWITKDNKYFYVCGESWMAWWGVWVYNYSDFSLYKDLTKEWEWYISNCYWFDWYNKDKNILNFELWWDTKYEYNFDTLEVIKK